MAFGPNLMRTTFVERQRAEVAGKREAEAKARHRLHRRLPTSGGKRGKAGRLRRRGVDAVEVEIDSDDAAGVLLSHGAAFGGLTIEETAEAMNISPATVKRHWTVARAWLARELAGT